MAQYENYGDMNFFEGGLFLMDAGDGDYEFIQCDFVNDTDGDTYLFTTGIVNANDSWVDLNAVRSSVEVHNDDGAELARAVLAYYGPENCGGHEGELLSSAEVQERMNGYTEEYEFDTDTWSAGPLC